MVAKGVPRELAATTVILVQVVPWCVKHEVRGRRRPSASSKYSLTLALVREEARHGSRRADLALGPPPRNAAAPARASSARAPPAR